MIERSQNNWIASKDPSAIDIKSFLIKGTDIHIRCNAVAGILLSAFAAEFHAKVEKLDNKIFDDWGYAYRPVRGQTTGLSNHASGTAIDLNATKHPLGKKGTFNGMQKIVLNALLAKYGIRWGGNYHDRPDEMHFEINEIREQVQQRITRLGLK